MFKYNHAFIVSRFQPFHNGHKVLIDKMLNEAKYGTIVLGSANERRTQRNPFTSQERIQMVKNVYGDNKNLNIFAVNDIPDDNKWYSYVMKNIERKSAKFGKLEAFYCGEKRDCTWFDKGELAIEMLDRLKQKENFKISGTEIRDMIKNKDDNWKKYIPEQNIKFVEDFFQANPTL